MRRLKKKESKKKKKRVLCLRTRAILERRMKRMRSWKRRG